MSEVRTEISRYGAMGLALPRLGRVLSLHLTSLVTTHGAFPMTTLTPERLHQLAAQAVRNTANRSESNLQPADQDDYTQEVYVRATEQMRKRTKPIQGEKQLRGLLGFIARSVQADDLRQRLGRTSPRTKQTAEQRREQRRARQRPEHDAAADAWPFQAMPEDAPTIRNAYQPPRVALVEMSDLVSFAEETASEQLGELRSLLALLPSRDLQYTAFTLAKGFTMTATAELLGIDRRELTRRRAAIGRRFEQIV